MVMRCSKIDCTKKVMYHCSVCRSYNISASLELNDVGNASQFMVEVWWDQRVLCCAKNATSFEA